MAKAKTEGIWRKYYGRSRNINKSAEIIHKYLFSRRNKSISIYNKKDADLLTKMFRDLKSAYNNNKDNIGGYAKVQILGNTISNVPILNFALGGNASSGDSGGIKFEQEILKLFSYEAEEEFKNAANKKNLGQETASVYIDLGKRADDLKGKALVEYVQKLVTDIADEGLNNIEKRILKGDQINANPPDALYLKVGEKRFGKIDVMAGKGATIHFDIEGEYHDPLKKAIDIASSASFSIKSYLTDAAIHLGNTDFLKAVSAVSEYVATKYDENARWAGIYYLHHPDGVTDEDEEKHPGYGDELYKHYNHMKDVYELTGLGLRYDDLDDLYSVDFLLVNRAQEGGDIKVFSTKYLLNTYKINNFEKYNIDI